ncbi:MULTISPECIES: LysR substrate-binding domain-containing protein [Pseudomonas]|uniref:LysR family transcriptional regulator n=2 Tax=Pseudomonas guariconensis TaxID=1288410 RepID=A0AAX0VSR6_9PSED|nr:MULTISPECIES: LysR substrate-binding domain-containing protein [Pseudomonas]MBH3360383.1 LysR family transcriptional regulator [Pseudomonas guariconensis]MCO7620250.1 LysR substrate-binding domain-containing protein [Pseudomonas guariconensis]MDM9592841.1 LysR substrate-binding domain-containing protein [Pseudomonas guariconensis]MDM9605668.1 LysR substrate-binding domain-containing protein [Pseudomonas guariconensis]MDM9610625.1 LysR substrate-binding domain-containing protein [Pseudomonas
MIGFTFRQLEYFVATAEQGSVSAAARAKHISQPSVSLAISQLEAILGEKLFLRQASRGLELSPAGRQLLEQAREILAMAAGIRSAGDEPQVLRGNLSLICFQDLGPWYAPRLLSGFRQRHPEVAMTLFETDLAGVNRRLNEGKAELALTYDVGLDPQIERRVLAQVAPYALLPADHPLARQEQVSLADLAEECLILEDIARTREYFLSLFWAHDLQPRAQQLTQTFEMQRGLVAHGYGVALSCTRPAGDQSYDGRPLACRPLREAVSPQSVVLAQSSAMRPSPAAQAFLRWASELFSV